MQRIRVSGCRRAWVCLVMFILPVEGPHTSVCDQVWIWVCAVYVGFQSLRASVGVSGRVWVL